LTKKEDRLRRLRAEKERLLYQAELVNPTTGAIIPSSFDWMTELYKRAVEFKLLNQKIKRCHKCEGMNLKGITENAVGFGSWLADIFFVGHSLGTPNMSTQMPFTRGSGYLIDAALWSSHLTRMDVFMSNIVHCHPQHNRAAKKTEKNNCAKFIKSEIKIIQPKLVVALGAPARSFMYKWVGRPEFDLFCMTHPAAFAYSGTKGIMRWIVTLSMELDKYV